MNILELAKAAANSNKQYLQQGADVEANDALTQAGLTTNDLEPSQPSGIPLVGGLIDKIRDNGRNSRIQQAIPALQDRVQAHNVMISRLGAPKSPMTEQEMERHLVSKEQRMYKYHLAKEKLKSIINKLQPGS